PCCYLLHAPTLITRCSSVYSLLYLYPPHRDLHSFPTRRSSDLRPERASAAAAARRPRARYRAVRGAHHGERRALGRRADRHLRRSEEHTSELQSHLNLVCRLLLEKKKKKI